ncbi:hypothetical protein [Pseudonocardia asaccharolytica]|uniref:Integral membrane protein n=1 Tax=Pseudonocardia asaccharolytica DSM 44247 = NBRC 16224 TaxID=1123024 RepID=A0A511CV00_9PSEU|nr:hypothetical protein [Pseudonocardia asaccharolytica]GEL16405.1 hypothetical protein PA7_02420 [Pseudonocardia asaccharolytica DSM 44247 = NBRC 16224]
MTALSASPVRIGDGLLRAALRLDAAASGALGASAAVTAPLLTDFLGIPAGVLVGVGIFLVLFAAGLLMVARPTVSPAAVRTVLIVNVSWAAAGVLAVVIGWSALTAPGVAVVLVQAAAVAIFAELQWAGLRRATGSSN